MRSPHSKAIKDLEGKAKALRADLEALESELAALKITQIPQPELGSRVRITTGRSLYGERYEEGEVVGLTKHRVKVLIDDKVHLRAPKNVQLVQDGKKRQEERER